MVTMMITANDPHLSSTGLFIFGTAGLVLKTTLVLLTAGAASFALRRASAAARHLAWSCAVVAVLLLPLAAGTLPSWRVTAPIALPVAVMPAADRPAAQPAASLAGPAAADASKADGVWSVASPVAAPASGAAVAGDPVLATRSEPALPPGSWLLIVWAAGAALVLGRCALGWWGVARLERRARPLAEPDFDELLRDLAWMLEVRRPVRLLRSAEVAMPLTWGTLRPVVVVPADAGEWSAERRRVVLAHELAHVRRLDCLTQTLAQLACALHWFNPLVWYAARRLRIERENACDDAVLALGTSGADYAGHLLEVARRFRPGVRLAGAAAIPMARPSQLEGRLLAVLDPLRPRGELRRRTLLNAAVAVVALVVVLGCVSVRAEDAPADSTAARVAASATGQKQIVAPRLLVSGNEGTPTDVRSAVQEPFRWRGEIPRGQTLEVRGIIGPITATRASGSETEVIAVRRAGRYGDPGRIRFETLRHAGGVTICAVYPSRDLDRPNRCSADAGDEIDLRRFDAEVHWTVRVPAGVALSARTVDGDVSATGLASDIRAATVDGDVRVATTGAASAATVDGDITAKLDRVAGPLSFTTVDGDITLALPANVDAQISASTLDGEILSDFPFSQRQGGWVARSASATLGRGGPAISLKTIDGDITLRSGRGSVLRAVPQSARIAPAASAPRPAPSPRPVPTPRPAPTPTVRLIPPAPTVPTVAPVAPTPPTPAVAPAPPPPEQPEVGRIVESAVREAMGAVDLARLRVAAANDAAEGAGDFANAVTNVTLEALGAAGRELNRPEIRRALRERIQVEVRDELRRELDADSAASRP